MFLFMVALNGCTPAYPPRWALCVGFCGGLAGVRCSVLAFFFLFFYFYFFILFLFFL
jgi:hypothetical protein